MTRAGRLLAVSGISVGLAVVAALVIAHRKRPRRRRRNPAAPMDRAVAQHKTRQSRAREREARTEGRSRRLEAARERCAVERSSSRQACKNRRAAAVERAKRDCAEDRQAVADVCAEGRDKARDEVAAIVATERSKRERIRDELAASVSRGRPRSGRKRSTERRDESDEYAKREIPRKFHRLWEKSKRRYSTKATPEQRAEAFMLYLHDAGALQESGAEFGTGGSDVERWLIEQEEKDVARREKTKSRDEWAEQRRIDAAKKAKARGERQRRIARREELEREASGGPAVRRATRRAPRARAAGVPF